MWYNNAQKRLTRHVYNLFIDLWKFFFSKELKKLPKKGFYHSSFKFIGKEFSEKKIEGFEVRFKLNFDQLV